MPNLYKTDEQNNDLKSHMILNRSLTSVSDMMGSVRHVRHAQL